MKLCFSPTSPYVRKVMACAITREIDDRIEQITTNANDSPPEFVAINPLSKVPALVTDDGVALFDSPVICEYLDSFGEALPMFPPHGASRWRAFRSVTLPLTMPGLLAGMVLVFALASSSYVVAALMGGWKVWVIPIHIYERISNSGQWQFGAAISTILFLINMCAVFVYQVVASRVAGGRV